MYVRIRYKTTINSFHFTRRDAESSFSIDQTKPQQSHTSYKFNADY
jgi:hypothetical protein